MPDFSRDDKTAFIARGVAPVPGTVVTGGTVLEQAKDSPHSYMVRIPMGLSSTLVGWVNPHVGQVLVNNVMYFHSAAGTGTIDVGTGTAGTGASAIRIDGGTMTGAVFAGGSGTAGAANTGALLAGSGTVADSITVTHDEAATGTAVGTLIFRVTVL